MICVNQTRERHNLNPEWNGMAGEQHVMCELALRDVTDDRLIGEKRLLVPSILLSYLLTAQKVGCL
jgi:hypothetical protein